MKYVSTLLVACITCTAVFAGTNGNNKSTSLNQLDGTIIDAETKRPLAEVFVVVRNTNTKAEVVVKTNADGKFSIGKLPEGNYYIRCRKDAYSPAEKANITIKQQLTTRVHFELETLEAAEGVGGDHRDMLFQRFFLR
jgi:hypothetical protein